jgi:WhiB family transcriptional regulator, redox-sensing transcriptional regulator
METFASRLARRARCNDLRGSLSQLFFSENPVDVMRAKAICSRCTVSGLCLAAAIERGEPCGVWGGEQVLDGRVVVGRRGRGRPRKTPLPSPHDVDEITGEAIA